MKKAGVKPGSEPVMLVGHSQGGIVAARLASNAQFRTRFKVTHVLTVASPESRITIPKSVQALSIEHRADPVPRVDTSTGPNTSNRTRAYIDPRSMMTPDKKGVVDEHVGRRYAETSTTHLGRDNTDPALRQWYSQTEGFMGGSDTRYSYDLTRPQPPSAPAPLPAPPPAPAPTPTQPPAWMTPRLWTAQTPSG